MVKMQSILDEVFEQFMAVFNALLADWKWPELITQLIAAINIAIEIDWTIMLQILIFPIFNVCHLQMIETCGLPYLFCFRVCGGNPLKTILCVLTMVIVMPCLMSCLAFPLMIAKLFLFLQALG